MGYISFHHLNEISGLVSRPYITFDKGMRGLGENYMGFLAIVYPMRMSKIDFFPYININFFMIRMQREYL